MKTREEYLLEKAIIEGTTRMKNPKTRNRGVESSIRFARRELRKLHSQNKHKPSDDWREHDTQGIY